MLAHLPSPNRQVMGGHNLWLGNHRSLYPVQLAHFNPWAGTAYFGETEGPSYGRYSNQS